MTRRLPAFRLISTVLSTATAVVILAATSACSRPPAAVAAPAALAVLTTLPPELTAALDAYRAEGPKGWAFTQTTTGGGKDRIERYDPRERGPRRWTLLSEKGVAPTEAEQTRYRETRPAFDAAANLAAQLDRRSAALVAQDDTTATYEFHLIPAGENDTSAVHMRARFTLNRAAGTFTRVELANIETFTPAHSLTIHEARTTLTYALPADGRPALPLETSMKISGKRFWVKAFEQHIVSTFSDHEDAHLSAPGTSGPGAAAAP